MNRQVNEIHQHIIGSDSMNGMDKGPDGSDGLDGPVG